MMRAVAALLMLSSCVTGAASNGGGPTGSPSGGRVRAASSSSSARAVRVRKVVPPEAGGSADSLYARLGGKDAIAAVIDEFLSRVSKDERVNGRFWNADMPRLRTLLVEFVCQVTGGPCAYTGKDMKAAHAGMAIAGSEFDALVENLKGALDAAQVPAAEQRAVMSALAPLKSEIVEVASEGVDVAATGRANDGEGKVVPERQASERADGGGKAASDEANVGDSADPVPGRVRVLRQASALLEKANGARLKGNRSYADQLFSSVELMLGSAAVADLGRLFRQGAPPRVTTPPQAVPVDAPAQPAVVGNSDDEQPAPKRKKKRAWLLGTVAWPRGRPLPGLAVVTLEPTTGKFPRRAPKQRVIEQRHREFAPRVLAIPVGSTVTFPNFDPIYHNVFSRSATHPFDLGIYKAGHARQLVFRKEGVVRIGCNLHANMSAFIAVVAAPHYVVADSAGRFSFRNVLPGRYRLRAWSENSESPSSQHIDVKPNENRVEVTLAPRGSDGLVADKFGAPRGGTVEQ